MIYATRLNRLIIHNDKLNIFSIINGKTVGLDKNKPLDLQRLQLSDDGKSIITLGKTSLKEEIFNKKHSVFQNDFLYLKYVIFDQKDNLFISLEGESYSGIDGGSGSNGDIEIVKFNSENEILWNTTIKKRQSANFKPHIGFTNYINTNGDLSIIFNSNAKNHPNFKQNSKLDGTLQHVLLNNETGGILTNIILAKDFKIYITSCVNFDNSFLLVNWTSYLFYKKK
jgi:hypothetical protein